MTASVVYCSLTGNTRQIARILADELGTQAKSVRDPASHKTDKLVIVGSGVYAGKPAPPLTRWLYHSPSMKGKKAAVFVTASDLEQGHQTADWIARVLTSKGAKVVDQFVCHGRFLIFSGWGHPNKHEKAAARAFARKLAKFCPKPEEIVEPLPPPPAPKAKSKPKSKPAQKQVRPKPATRKSPQPAPKKQVKSPATPAPK
ncbi:MAG TPA: hypothetical protein ENN60_04095 [archaeon]|nr:hypothetical protein [archaeon]